ncbi:MAG: hypothetical protein K2X29_15395 [Candidatus Obscuribacterales bacterium]|nr:hypothetical protein [Candidatus Obscuribacterales bacterium]
MEITEKQQAWFAPLALISVWTIIMLCPTWFESSRIFMTRNWPSAEGIVTRVENTYPGLGKWSMILGQSKVEYTYFINDSQFVGREESPPFIRIGAIPSEKLLVLFKPGNRLIVKYDPAHPESSIGISIVNEITSLLFWQAITVTIPTFIGIAIVLGLIIAFPSFFGTIINYGPGIVLVLFVLFLLFVLSWSWFTLHY